MKNILTLMSLTFFLFSCSQSQKFQMNWKSMFPTYDHGEISSYIPIQNDIQRWDIIIMNNDSKIFMKRVIWLPWETLKIENGNVFIRTDKSEYIPLDETKYLWKDIVTDVRGNRKSKEFIILEWEYFVMWDNREKSTDSRTCFQSCSREWWKHTIWLDQIEGVVILKN